MRPRDCHGPIDAIRHRTLMAYFTGYFDESGKFQQHEIVSFCGFLDSNWADFEDNWNYLLRKHRIPYLHLSKRVLKATTKELRMYGEFIQTIKRYVEHGFAYAVDVTAFNSLHRAIKRFAKDDPHYWAFHGVLRDVIKYASALPNPSVAVVCDDEPSKACQCYTMFDRMRQDVKQPENRRVLKSIAFADDEFYPQLQAADLFSWVSRAEAMYRFRKATFPLRDLYREFVIADETKIQFTSPFWDAEHLKEVETRSLPQIKFK
jgi:hypothetical protein